MSTSEHRCELPWMGSLFQCPVCGVWYHVVVFRDDEEGITWKGWEPVDAEASEVR